MMSRLGRSPVVIVLALVALGLFLSLGDGGTDQRGQGDGSVTEWLLPAVLPLVLLLLLWRFARSGMKDPRAQPRSREPDQDEPHVLDD